ncbi:hypothetical protein [Nocardia niwae]|uniref:hypothetical protein n=1 Tax=Nocardia niwae TaxID=626084 RepID=UPI0007A48FF8|nr:hypothetical protein [Nocardia niwae]
MNRVDTTHILELVAEYDNREIHADLISEWHHAIGHLAKTVAIEAVNIHHKTSAYRITPNALLEIAEQIQQRPTSQRPMRRAIMLAYQVNGAINYPCDTCGAKPGDTCTAKTGQEAHCPCVSRLTGKTIAA